MQLLEWYRMISSAFSSLLRLREIDNVRAVRSPFLCHLWLEQQQQQYSLGIILYAARAASAQELRVTNDAFRLQRAMEKLAY